MLVLTRKPGQSIMIGDRVEVQVLSVAGEKVRLGITAPRDVSIFRNEVYDRIEHEAPATPTTRARTPPSPMLSSASLRALDPSGSGCPSTRRASRTSRRSR